MSLQRRGLGWLALGGTLSGLVLGLSLWTALSPVQAEVGATDRSTGDAVVQGGDFIVPYDGYLALDSTPLNGGITLEFQLYEWDDTTSALATTPEWTEQQTVNLYNGRFSVGLGSTTSLTDDLLDADKLYLRIGIVGASSTVLLTGHQAIEPVPYAQWSRHASNMALVGELIGGRDALGVGAHVGGTVHVDTLDDTGAGTLTVDGSLASANLTSTGAVTIGNTLTVTGTTTAESDLELAETAGWSRIQSLIRTLVLVDTDTTNELFQFAIATGSANNLRLLMADTGNAQLYGNADVGTDATAGRASSDNDLSLDGDVLQFVLESEKTLSRNSSSTTSTSSSTSLGSLADRVCFLTAMHHNDIDDNEEFWECRVYRTSTEWRLRAREGTNDNGSGGYTYCAARCLQLPLDD